MVHSIELVFDPDTEAAVRQIWDELRGAGLTAQPPAARPHTTLTVAEHIDEAVRLPLAGLADRFPFPARIGAAVIFGRSAAILARLVVPNADLFDLHTQVFMAAAAHLRPGPMPHTMPGDWTPHVTLARRVGSEQLATAVRIAERPTEIQATVTGLRWWDGNARAESRIC